MLLHSIEEGFDAAASGERIEESVAVDELVGQSLHVYHCQSLLGSGGMGRVYLAHHRDLHRKCALKILSPELAKRDQDYVARFQHEGRATAAIVHPNIITIHAIGYTDHRHFLEMEFVAGPTLQQVLSDEGALTPIRATSLAAQLAEGLSAAHRNGIVHRDLKPDNVLMTPAGVPKIADFGLAKRVAGGQGLNEQGYLAGTPNFMAPELFQGAEATPASDIYALGVCYFLFLTGRFPFVGSSINELMRVTATEPIPDVRESNPAITLEMAECLSMMLAKSPELRPSDGMSAGHLLRAVLGQIRDVESLLKEAFKSTSGISWRRESMMYRVQVDFEGGRQQQIFIEPSTHAARERVLMIYSICCPARREYYEDALRMNSEILHGGLAIREIDGQPMFVMVDTYPRATVDPEEIRRSALEVARRADEVEERLTGMDHN